MSAHVTSALSDFSPKGYSGETIKHRLRREPVFSTDTDGREIVRVTTSGGEVATLFAQDFRRITAQGFSDQWATVTDGKDRSRSYVAVGVWGMSGISMIVGRLVAEAKKGEKVSYIDGDRLNLRRNNLVVSKGYSKGREKLAAITASRRSEASHWEV